MIAEEQRAREYRQTHGGRNPRKKVREGRRMLRRPHCHLGCVDFYAQKVQTEAEKKEKKLKRKRTKAGAWSLPSA